MHLIELSNTACPPTTPIPFGELRDPDGKTITADANSLRRDGRPWLTTMGEFHFSRYPRSQWRDELLKMQSGGIGIASSYVFWNHHEEVRGQHDWSGRRDLRAYVALCGELSLPFVLRIGPWCHGEVRLGGLPDWLLKECGECVRTNDTAYLRHAEAWYAGIFDQVRGLQWKDGGPIIGVQIENEYHGPAEHMLSLKERALSVGFDVPLITRTGWPELTSSMPFGEMLPLHGGYAEGFWDRSLEPMPGTYWREFTFSPTSPNTAVATDHFGEREATAPDAGYPYLTCEMGAGMMTSYHRRILAYPEDAYALAITKLGSGSNLLGYYMYHGGVNPESRLGTLNERQDSPATNHNDLPVKSYDFQTALGEAGTVRPQYHQLRRLHTFLDAYGEKLALMPACFPKATVRSKTDTQTLRCALRSDGVAGYLFVNQYQRSQAMPKRSNIQFELKHANGDRSNIPDKPITVPGDVSFFWPIGQWFGEDVRLRYATAQPLTSIEHKSQGYHFFMQIPGIAAEFVLESADGSVKTHRRDAGRAVSFSFETKAVRQHIVLLSEQDADRLYRGTIAGVQRVVLCDAVPLFERGHCRLQQDVPVDVEDSESLSISVFAPNRIAGATGSCFAQRELPLPQRSIVVAPALDRIRCADPPSGVRNGPAGVPQAPAEDDFESAAEYRITWNADEHPGRHLLLRIAYIGDIARVEAGGKLLTDNFYNGREIEIDLLRYADELASGELRLKILPLRRDSPVLLADEAKPEFGTEAFVERVVSLQWIERVEALLEDRCIDVDD